MAAVTTDQLNDLLACFDQYMAQSRLVPEYDPAFPGPQGEPLSTVCPANPARPPRFQTSEQPTHALCLCNLNGRMSEPRLHHFLRRFLRRSYEVTYLRLFLNSDGRTAWALVAFTSVRDAYDAHRALNRQRLDGQVLFSQFCSFAI